MTTTRIELKGDAGHVAIERAPDSATIRIDSIVEPQRQRDGDLAWKTWELPADVNEDELHKVAAELHQRCEGTPGTPRMIQAYYRELKRFAD